MTLDADILAVFSEDWDETIIVKPAFKISRDVPTNPQFQTQDMKKRPKSRPIPALRTMYINAKQKGTLKKENYDNSTDQCAMNFELIYSEMSEDEANKVFRAAKKALHRADVSGGHYHIDDFQFDISPQITTVILMGHRFQQLEDDAF